MAATSVTDPVSFTADATKLVIRSVKATYDALSSVKHGSNRIESMLVSLTQLQRIVAGFRQRGTAGTNIAEQLILPPYTRFQTIIRRHWFNMDMPLL